MNLIIRLLAYIKFDVLFDKIVTLRNRVHLNRIERITNQKIKYVGQGPGGIQIVGDLKKIKIASTSHLKSNTFIECRGGVEIGEYFHTGRGLTIFSTNHNWRSEAKIPYDNVDIFRPVVIQDCVWCGSNVTIAPGAKIGKGAILATGSVIFGNVPDYAIVKGNPAVVVKYRDKVVFDKLFNEGKFN
jgi:acetyltransferase-like isoleucine patch superfamily enzyme